jgi:hypothetical protein
MLTICRGEPEDYNQASEFMDVAIEDIEKFDNYFNVLRRDIYLLVNKKVHETMNLSRVEFFKQIKYKTKINKNLINDFVNAALVESHLDIIQGTVPLDVLLALRFKANKADWEEIYLRAVGDKEKNIRELKQKQKVRISRYRTRHIKRMSLNLVPTITSITKGISNYYKDNNKIKPKKASTYEYWDEVRIKNNIFMDGDDIIFI